MDFILLAGVTTPLGAALLREFLRSHTPCAVVIDAAQPTSLEIAVRERCLSSIQNAFGRQLQGPSFVRLLEAKDDIASDCPTAATNVSIIDGNAINLPAFVRSHFVDARLSDQFTAHTTTAELLNQRATQVRELAGLRMQLHSVVSFSRLPSLASGTVGLVPRTERVSCADGTDVSVSVFPVGVLSPELNVERLGISGLCGETARFFQQSLMSLGHTSPLVERWRAKISEVCGNHVVAITSTGRLIREVIAELKLLRQPHRFEVTAVEKTLGSGTTPVPLEHVLQTLLSVTTEMSAKAEPATAAIIQSGREEWFDALFQQTLTAWIGQCNQKSFDPNLSSEATHAGYLQQWSSRWRELWQSLHGAARHLSKSANAAPPPAWRQRLQTLQGNEQSIGESAESLFLQVLGTEGGNWRIDVSAGGVVNVTPTLTCDAGHATLVCTSHGLTRIAIGETSAMAECAVGQVIVEWPNTNELTSAWLEKVLQPLDDLLQVEVSERADESADQFNVARQARAPAHQLQLVANQ